MVRQLTRIGDGKGIVMSKLMLEHLRVTDQVELYLEHGRIVIKAPARIRPERRGVEDYKEPHFTQFE